MDAPPGEKDWEKKRREYEAKKARAKALRMRLTCIEEEMVVCTQSIFITHQNLQ